MRLIHQVIEKTELSSMKNTNPCQEMKERRSANKYSSHAALVKVKWAPGSRPNELVCVCSVAQSCPAPLWPRGLCSPPRSCVHGIFQAQLSLILADSLGSRTSFWVQRDQETGIRLLIWNDFESITPLLKKKKKKTSQLSLSVSTSQVPQEQKHNPVSALRCNRLYWEAKLTWEKQLETKAEIHMLQRQAG